MAGIDVNMGCPKEFSIKVQFILSQFVRKFLDLVIPNVGSDQKCLNDSFCV